jgi:GNAT superfamily N-acetyltransferase
MHWRQATVADDDAVLAGSLALYREDPSPHRVGEAQIRATLAALRDPARGQVVVLADDAGAVHGYAFLVSFWSNELGGAACVIDELWVAPAARSQGHGGALIDRLAAGALWPAPLAALLLEVTPSNRARAFYARKGFVGKNLGLRRVL